jgi:hypothetical protein
MSAGALSLRPKTIETILGWWAQELGVNTLELKARADGVTLSPSSNLPGVFLFRRGADLRIAALLPKLKLIHDAILGKTFRTIFTAKFWTGLPLLNGLAVGPAALFYLDSIPTQWVVRSTRGIVVRGLSAIDAKPFAEFFEALNPLEREHSGLELGPRPLWGAFKGKELVAVSGYDAWPGRIAHVGVAVHPAHRGLKLAQLVVQAAARGAVARRRIVQYRALIENGPSLGIATALNFVAFAETLYIRPAAAA